MNDAKTVTVEQLDEFVLKIKTERERAEVLSQELKLINIEINALEARAAQYLKELGRDNYRSPHGMISLQRKWRVNLPSSDQRMAELFEHLSRRGIFEEYATVNSNSLNALYMADWKAAQDEGKGMEYTMPGIDAPKLHETVRFLKGSK